MEITVVSNEITNFSINHNYVSFSLFLRERERERERLENISLGAVTSSGIWFLEGEREREREKTYLEITSE